MEGSEFNEESSSSVFSQPVMSRKEIIVRILKGWKFIFITSFVVGVLGITYAYFSMTTYSAYTSLMLEGSRAGGGNSYLQIAQQFGIVGGSSGGELDENKLEEIFKARRTLSTAFFTKAEIKGKNDYLANHFIDVLKLRPVFEKNPKLKGFSFAENPTPENKFIQDSLIGIFCRKIIKNMDVKKGVRSKILEIWIETPSELFSLYYCDAIVNSVSEYYIAKKSQKERYTYDVIRLHVDSIQDALEKAQNAYAGWKDSNKKVIKVKGYVEEINLKRQLEILLKIYGEAVKNMEVAKFDLLVSTPIVQIIDHPILPLDKIKPSKIIFGILGGMIGVFLGVFLLFAGKTFTFIRKEIKFLLASEKK